MVIRSTSLIPEMREGTVHCHKHCSINIILSFLQIAFFQCFVCRETKTVEIDRGRISEPAVCPNCESLHTMALIHNRSMFTDKQMIKLQESPGRPHTCDIIVSILGLLIKQHYKVIIIIIIIITRNK